MPFIDTKLNFRLSEEKEIILKTRLAQAIECFSGKSEYWLMLNFTDNSRMWYRGYNNFPIAMVEVKLFGTPNGDACEKMTQRISEIYQEELGITPDHVYVKYEFTDHWGWSGENF